jgi:hypothetical protein
MNHRVFLFGEAERGAMRSPIHLNSLPAILQQLGNPPPDSIGIDYAIQTVLFKRELIFYRVREEGFSLSDYFDGVKLLYNSGNKLRLSAICLPGVGDAQIIEALGPICHKINSVLILNEKDLYDYLTNAE